MNINATLIGQSLAFFVFVWFCKRYVWPPMITAMQARQEQIFQVIQAIATFRKVFLEASLGLFVGSSDEIDADLVFA